MFKTVKMIDVSDWDDLVEKTYGKTYSFQQQDGCQQRGIRELTVPDTDCFDFEKDIVPEVVNSEDMGVSFTAWLNRDPNQKLVTDDDWDRENGLHLWWSRTFYPSVQMVANDLYAKGLLEAGEYVINIDW